MSVSVYYVHPLVGNSLLKRLITLSHTQRATKVNIFAGICLKPLRSRVMPQNRSEKANIIIILIFRGQLSPLDTRRSVRGVPNDCQQHSALPKTMPTDAASLCWRTKELTATRVYSYNARRGQLPRTCIGVVRARTRCAEGFAL